MSWAYLIIFNEKVGTRKEVQAFIDTIPEITYWYGCVPQSIFCISSLTAGQLSDKLKDRYGTSGGQRFFVTEVHQDRQGWMPKQVWHMLKNPDEPRLPK
jgi:hypothetical protein